MKKKSFDIQDMHDWRYGAINIALFVILIILFIVSFGSAWCIAVGSFGTAIFTAAMVRGKGWGMSRKAFVYFFLIGGVISALAYWLLT